MSKWSIIAVPEGKNPGRKPGSDQDTNEGAMVVMLTNGTLREEVARVGFVRRNAKNPEVGYKEQLHDVVETARESLRVLERLLADAGQPL